MLAISLWAGCAATTLLIRDLGIHLFVERIQWIGIAFIPVFMVVFALSYTGYDELASWSIFGVLSVFPLVTIGIVFSGWGRDLLWTDPSIVVIQGVALSVETSGGLYYAFVLYSYALIAVGALLIVRLVVISDYLFLDQAVLLVVGVLTPVVANAMSVAGFVPFPGFEATPFGFTVTGLTFGYALFRRRLFDLVPATRRLGRDTAIATLDDGVLILDKTFSVIYLNPEAAAILDRAPQEALGASATDLADIGDIDFDVPDALAELHIEDRWYEVRPSTITDRRDRAIGYTLVFHDVTARKRRERRLCRQRDELERIDTLNQVVHDSTHAFVSATTQTEIEEITCDRLRDSTLYTEATIILDPADEIVTGDGETNTERTGTSVVTPTTSGTKTGSPSEALLDVIDTEHGSWAAIPLGYDWSIYGALVVYTTRADAFESREVAVLDQFGETISQAMNAVENQRLLLADTVTELEFECPDAALATIATDAECGLSLRGLVPASDGEVLVYCCVADGSPRRVVEAASAVDGIVATRSVDDAEGIVEFVLDDRSVLLALSTGGTNVRTLEAAAGVSRVVVEVSSETDVRAFLQRVRAYCPRTTLVTKRYLDRPITPSHGDDVLSEGAFNDLTQRQHEVLEAAYRAGYFRWPRDRTAEEVAESINISSPTLHKHLRRAEEQLLDGLFDSTEGIDHARKRA